MWLKNILQDAKKNAIKSNMYRVFHSNISMVLCKFDGFVVFRTAGKGGFFSERVDAFVISSNRQT